MYRLLLLFICLPFITDGQIVNIEDRRSIFKDTIGWFENLDLGFNLVKNDERVLDLNGAFQIEVLQKNRIFLSLTKFHLIRAGDKQFVNQGFQHLRFTRLVSSHFSVETFGQIQYNEQIFIKLRGLLGMGPRIKLYHNKNKKLHLGVAYMYEYEEESGNFRIHRSNRLSSYLSIGFRFNKIVHLASTTYFQPNFEAISDYRMSSQTSLRFLVFKNLHFRTAFSYTYDTRVSEGAPATVYNLSQGISYAF